MKKITYLLTALLALSLPALAHANPINLPTHYELGPTVGRAPFVLSGSIDPTASASVVGVGTHFLTELKLGDQIDPVTGVYKTVVAIADDTHLTLDSPCTDGANNTTVHVHPAIAGFTTSAGALALSVQPTAIQLVTGGGVSNINGDGSYRFYSADTITGRTKWVLGGTGDKAAGDVNLSLKKDAGQTGHLLDFTSSTAGDLGYITATGAVHLVDNLEWGGAADVNAFGNLRFWAGSNTITLRTKTQVGGDQAVGGVPLSVQGVSGQTADLFDVTAYGGGAGGLFAIGAAGKMTRPTTDTAIGTTGAITANTPCGIVNIAATGTSVVVTDSLVSATSHVFVSPRTPSATARVSSVVPTSGSFTLTIVADASVTTQWDFMVVN
jgi:hypothetical protein